MGLKPKVLFSEYTLLDESKQCLVQRVGDGSIITRFDKTPHPVNDKDVVCPHFLELKWAYGCPFNCAWCYLKGTFRFQPTGTRPILKPLPKTIANLESFFMIESPPEILNSGEIADSLMFENSEAPFSKEIIPLFQRQGKHKVLLVTKSTNVKNLVGIDPRQIIVSFSLNADLVAAKWEKGAPSVRERIEAAKKLANLGYEVRLRIDPVVPILDWKKHYKALLDRIFGELLPERLTIGSLRGLQSTINGVTDKSWIKYLSEGSGWGKRIEFNTRYWMYRTLIDHLSEKHNYTRVALCKETVEMWRKIEINYREIRCNCIW